MEYIGVYMKKILCLLVIIVLITGCSDTSLEIDGKKGKVTSICTSSSSLTGIKTNNVITTNFDDDLYAINMKVKYTEIIEDNNEFDSRVKSIKETAKSLKDDKDVVYRYSIDKKNKTITTVSLYNKLNLNSLPLEEKEKYHAKNYIENNMKISKCEVSGITLQELGIE